MHECLIPHTKAIELIPQHLFQLPSGGLWEKNKLFHFPPEEAVHSTIYPPPEITYLIIERSVD